RVDRAGSGRRHRVHCHELSGFRADDAAIGSGFFMIIAIDGPAASGKGTLGKRLAHHYHFRHLDTGVIYRAVAKALLDAGADLDDEAVAVAAAPPGAVLDGRDIGTVICPDADVKIFVVADPVVRARRRTLEARARGEEV